MNRLIASRMSEDELERHIRQLIADLGLWGYHAYDSRRCEKGWPDWTIIGNRVLFRELKSEAGSLTVEQRSVGSKLTRAGQSWAVWRPRDLLNGTISRQLGEISGRQGELFGRSEPGPCYGPDCDHVSHRPEYSQ